MSATHSGVSTSDPSALHRTLRLTSAKNVFQVQQLSECSESSGLILPQGSLLRNLYYLSLSVTLRGPCVCVTLFLRTDNWVVAASVRRRQPPDDAVIFRPLMNIDLLFFFLIVPLCECMLVHKKQQTVFVEQQVSQVYSQRSQISNLLCSLGTTLQQVSFLFNSCTLQGDVFCLYELEKLRWFGWSFHPSVFEVHGFFPLHLSPWSMVNGVVHQRWIVLLYWQPSGKTSQTFPNAISACLFFPIIWCSHTAMHRAISLSGTWKKKTEDFNLQKKNNRNLHFVAVQRRQESFWYFWFSFISRGSHIFDLLC